MSNVHRIHIPINDARRFTEEYIRDIQDDPFDEEARAQLYDMIDRVTDQEEQSGDADDFHNFAVSLAKENQYVLACKIIELGLSLYPKNVDLLSDYLQYGSSCNKKEECSRYYGLLTGIPYMRWTWRGYTFAIDYLKYLADEIDTEEGLNESKEKMLDIAGAFRTYFSYAEDSYFAESTVYRYFNERSKEIQILEEGLEAVQVCPKCALRLGDIYLESGDIQKALNAIDIGINAANQAPNSVNVGYLYYLAGLCKTAAVDIHSDDVKQIQVEDIYSDFNIALLSFGSNGSYNSVIKEKTNALVMKSDVEVPERMEELLELIEY